MVSLRAIKKANMKRDETFPERFGKPGEESKDRHRREKLGVGETDVGGSEEDLTALPFFSSSAPSAALFLASASSLISESDMSLCSCF